MHACIPFTLVGRFANQLMEGRTYEITNFLVTPYEGTYKCVKGDVHILFSHLTTITEVPQILEDIFEFAHLATIDQVHFQDDHCIGINCTLILLSFISIIFTQKFIDDFFHSFVDVVGIIVSRKGIQYITNTRNEQHMYLELVISDTM